MCAVAQEPVSAPCLTPLIFLCHYFQMAQLFVNMYSWSAVVGLLGFLKIFQCVMPQHPKRACLHFVLYVLLASSPM